MAVYFAQRPSDNAIKIGYSRVVPFRLTSLAQSSNIPVLHWVGVIDNGDLDLERALHRAFAAFHLKGEWFKPALAIVNFVRTIERPVVPQNLHRHSRFKVAEVEG